MKITALSDWHGNFRLCKDIPNSDVICVCGDMIARTYDVSIYPEWLENLPAKLVLVIPGNHDALIDEYWEPNSKKVFNPNIKPVEYEGVTFGGLSWCYTEDPILEEVWDFMTTNKRFLEDKLYSLSKCDVLLSHSPPANCDMEIFSGQDIGIPGLLDWATERLGCKIIVCGHVHEHSGATFEKNGLKVINVACTMTTFEI